MPSLLIPYLTKNPLNGRRRPVDISHRLPIPACASNDPKPSPARLTHAEPTRP
jgi:hypothetical protein